MKRRNFLKTLSVSPFVVNGFNMRPFANSGMAKALSDCADVEGRVLVIIQLKGGNDGLNTLIPIFQYDTYANMRPNIKVPDSGDGQYIELDSTVKNSFRTGLNPAMTAIKELYDKGWANIIQGVGYQSPNLSHFRSTDLWLSGGDGTFSVAETSTGWIGRSLQALYPDVKGKPITSMPDPLGIQVGDPNPSLGFHTETEHQSAINLSGQDPAGFYSLVQTIGGAPIDNVPDSEHGEELEYIMSVEQSVSEYAQRITDVFNAGTNALSYPNISLANQLKTVARLIRGGCKTKVYLCSTGGYDTHSAQVAVGQTYEGNHYDLLWNLSQSVKAFMDDLDAMGIADQVMACSFSEFGRTVYENGSNGTDHGTLAPMFVFGKGVKPGISGPNVNLSNLTSGNHLQNMNFDYRQVFGTLLQDWLGVNDYVMAASTFDSFVKMPLVNPSHVVDPGCYYGGTEIAIDNDFNRAEQFVLYPNPARHTVEITFKGKQNGGGRLSMFSLSGQMIYSGRVQIQPGSNIFYLDVSKQQTGTYIVRLDDETTGLADVAKLSVVR
ncbi:MAG: DUF1501 domain-containing protein [Saprospiraceae bacterium]